MIVQRNMKTQKRGQSMKKYIALFIIGMLCFVTAACSSENKGGTYYPSDSEMKANLENAGYTVTVEEQQVGTYLSAVKGDDYIEFYRLKQTEYVESIGYDLKGKHTDFDKFASMKNDAKFGTLVFCGTSPAVDASGIIIVEVKV